LQGAEQQFLSEVKSFVICVAYALERNFRLILQSVLERNTVRVAFLQSNRSGKLTTYMVTCVLNQVQGLSLARIDDCVREAMQPFISSVMTLWRGSIESENFARTSAVYAGRVSLLCLIRRVLVTVRARVHCSDASIIRVEVDYTEDHRG
jgi:hypothetical protein